MPNVVLNVHCDSQYFQGALIPDTHSVFLAPVNSEGDAFTAPLKMLCMGNAC